MRNARKTKITVNVRRPKIKLSQVLLLLTVTTVISLIYSLAMYRSAFGLEVNANPLATHIINTTEIEQIVLEKMKPGDEKTYNFSIKNYITKDGVDEVSNTAINYMLTFETGNYLPITLELYEVNNGVVGTNNILTTNSTNEKSLSITKESDAYLLKIKWPGSSNDYRYSKEIDYVKILLNSYQQNPNVATN